MNPKIKKIIAVSIILILSLGVAGLAGAQKACPMKKEAGASCPGMKGEGPGCMDGSMACQELCQGASGIRLKQLMTMDLTDEQKTKVANVLAAHREQSRQLEDGLAEARQSFLDILHSEKAIDETAVRQAFRKMSDIMENQMVLKTKIIAALKPVLNQDQLMELTAHPSKKSGDGENMKHSQKQPDFRREMMDTWIRAYADEPEAKK